MKKEFLKSIFFIAGFSIFSVLGAQKVFNKYLLNDYQRNMVNAVNFHSHAIFIAMVAG